MMITMIIIIGLWGLKTETVPAGSDQSTHYGPQARF